MATFTATSAVQTLGNGTNNTGNDTFVIGPGTVQAGDIFNGGTGTDTLSMSNNATIDFSVATLTSMELLTFGSGGSVTFNAGQFSGSLISTNLAVNGAGGSQAIVINNASSFSAASWTFGSWTSGTDTITINGMSGNDTITGSAQADTITGGTGADIISAGGGNDTINIATGQFVAVNPSTAVPEPATA
jgi:Ca2+-binding RTX toxin-like protein